MHNHNTSHNAGKKSLLFVSVWLLQQQQQEELEALSRIDTLCEFIAHTYLSIVNCKWQSEYCPRLFDFVRSCLYLFLLPLFCPLDS